MNSFLILHAIIIIKCS